MTDLRYIGIDIGGTAVKVGVCDAEGRLLHTFEGPTETDKGRERVLDNIAAYARRCADEASLDWERIAGVGVGLPGQIDAARGVVEFIANLPLAGVRLKDHLESVLGRPVRISNDANVAALGEAWSGAGRGVASSVTFTLGTGVGGGIVVGGRVIDGFSGMGGELGHMVIVPDSEAVRCGCGKTGCLETVASATGIVRMAREAVEMGVRTSLAEAGELTAKAVFDAARAGDEAARRIVGRAAHYLGRSMALVAVVINPQRFIIGGGVAKAGEFLLEQVREAFRAHAIGRAGEGVSIVAAKLGNNAGVIGAAGLVRKL
ncbi:ROK family protein, putative glucokinase [Thermobacillus composti KWC4]|jgi:glucokinase|uniref:Glucokinase n=1 Tax=Thermobacillus composti (strain DSM 18247 / JCM 13945 / KWC4) TaxID=717605 RepID=L0ECS2_THECK|nr:ROK family glucokinase [Thermobacillus composti]AGA57414.1 ROK family protein, putative glucokinase [Thermobacillus composti KWC4]